MIVVMIFVYLWTFLSDWWYERNKPLVQEINHQQDDVMRPSHWYQLRVDHFPLTARPKVFYSSILVFFFYPFIVTFNDVERPWNIFILILTEVAAELSSRYLVLSPSSECECRYAARLNPASQQEVMSSNPRILTHILNTQRCILRTRLVFCFCCKSFYIKTLSHIPVK